jgi:hypothetical protein
VLFLESFEGLGLSFIGLLAYPETCLAILTTEDKVSGASRARHFPLFLDIESGC